MTNTVAETAKFPFGVMTPILGGPIMIIQYMDPVNSGYSTMRWGLEHGNLSVLGHFSPFPGSQQFLWPGTYSLFPTPSRDVSNCAEYRPSLENRVKLQINRCLG